MSECQAYLQYGDDLLHRVQEAAGRAVPLRITVLEALAHRYAPFFNDFCQQHPEIPLDIHMATQRELLLQLQNGRTDFIIGLQEELQKDKEIKKTVLHQEDEGILVPADASFAQEMPVPLETLKEHPFVLLQEEEAPHTLERFYQHCHQLGFHPHVVGTSSNIMEVVFWVEIHKGLSVLPRHMIDFVVTTARFLPLAGSALLIVSAAWKELGKSGRCVLEALKLFDCGQ